MSAAWPEGAPAAALAALEAVGRDGQPADLALASPYEWALACHYLFEAGRIDLLDRATRRLHAAFPELPYLATLVALLDAEPRHLPPPLPFTDDPAAEIQVVPRPGCGAVLLCFCARAGTLGLPLNFMHRWHGRVPASLIYLKDFRNLSGALGFPSLGPDRPAALAALRRLVPELGGQRLYTLGVSGGGYAALHYGFHLGAAGVLNLCGRIDMTRAFNDRIGTPSSIYRDVAECAPDYVLNLGELYAGATRRPFVLTAFNADSDRDRLQAQQLAGLANVELVSVPGYGQHNVVDSLVRERLYLPLLQRLLASA